MVYKYCACVIIFTHLNAYISQRADRGVDGIIVSNTTVQRHNLQSVYKEERGGLSGRPLKDVATSVISQMYLLTDGEC